MDDCKHRGELLRTAAGKTCRGETEADVFACALHGECTRKHYQLRRKNGAFLAACARCLDRKPPPRGSQPQPQQPQPAAAPSKKLTLGMACYERITEVIFTLQANELLHADVWKEVDLVVVDNHPPPMRETPRGELTLGEWMQRWKPGGQYVPFPQPVGTSAPRDHIFRVARGEIVCVIDAHVLIVPGALRTLIDWFAARPDFHGLLHGPLLGDHLQPMATHMDAVWRAEMFGTWAFDKQLLEQEGEISLNGLGLFACRKSDWPGFPEGLRGFGGEEGMLHELFRRDGRPTISLPWLRWWHYFGKPNGIAYPLTLENKVRNYLIWCRHLRRPIDDVVEHFADRLGFDKFQALLNQVQGLPLQGRNGKDDAHGRQPEAAVARFLERTAA